MSNLTSRERLVTTRYLAYGTMWQLRAICRFVVAQVKDDATTEERALKEDCQRILRKLADD